MSNTAIECDFCGSTTNVELWPWRSVIVNACRKCVDEWVADTPKSDIQYVKQEEPFGCVIAVIAMILGKPYQEIKALLPPERGYGNRNGMTSGDAITFLWLHGFVGVEFYKCESHTQRMRELQEWLKPVGQFNKVSVINEFGPHAILWMPDGRVFDPNKPGIHKITDYKDFHSLTAFWIKPCGGGI